MHQVDLHRKATTMICPACQADVEPDSLFCPKCGEKLDPVEAPTIRDESAKSEPAPRAQSAADRFRQQTGAPPVPDDDDEEKKLWEGTYSGKAMFGQWLGAGVITILLVIGGILASLWGFSIPFIWPIIIGLVVLMFLFLGGILLYRRMAIRYRLTNQRFIHEHGVLTRVIDRIEVIDIDDVGYKQNIVERMLNVGNIEVTSGDRTHPELKIIGIEDVERVYDLIDKARRDERVRRGIHVAKAGGGDGL